MDSVFEGAPVKIPAKFEALLEAEYGPESMTKKEFAQYVLSVSLVDECGFELNETLTPPRHRFDDELLEWVRDDL